MFTPAQIWRLGRPDRVLNWSAGWTRESHECFRRARPACSWDAGRGARLPVTRRVLQPTLWRMQVSWMRRASAKFKAFCRKWPITGSWFCRREAARFLPAMPNAPRPIERLAIVTCDRPNLLNRCVRSFAQNVKSSGRSVEFIVSDDSRGQANQLANRESLLTIVREFGLSIRYAAKRERGAFSDSLAREAGVDPEIARFGFSGSGGAQQAAFGANRNAMLMECAGEPFLTSDDDVVCRLSAAPDAREPVTFCRGEDPIEFWFHPSQDEALAACRPRMKTSSNSMKGISGEPAGTAPQEPQMSGT